MRSPIVAMLWENWRLTRVEAALRFALGIVAGCAALLLFDGGASVAFWILMVLHGMFVWFSVLKLNGGRFADGYKPGFPFHLHYTRPVRTVTFVGVAMAYDAVSCTALYLLSSALLGIVSGQPLPLFSVVFWIVAAHFCYHCIQWSTSNRVFQWVGSMAFGWPLFFLLKNRAASPMQVEFSLAENALMALIAAVAFGLTVAGVVRQRRGGVVVSAARTVVSGGYPNWLISLFRFSCPTSSAMRAQVWFELKSSGLPVLSIGLTLAILVPLLFAISIPVTIARPFALGVALFLAPAALLLLGGNAFGIRRRQGRTYLSTFEATQPYGTAQQAALKVLVKSSCMLAALGAVGVSLWASSSLVNAWGSWTIEGNALNGAPGLTDMLRAIEGVIGGLPVYALAALAIITFIAIAVMTASLAAMAALRARYLHRVIVAASLLLLGVLSLVALAWAAQRGVASEFLVDAILAATKWLAAAVMALVFVYLLWNSFTTRVLTLRYVCGAFVISAAFGAACMALLHGVGARFSEIPATGLFAMLLLPLVPLLAGVLAPWSLSRIRHI